MNKAFRGRTRDIVAAIVLAIAGIATLLVIISQQKASLPAWVPVLGEDFFELRAEFLPAQAVTPGQGQAVQIAGITVGKVGDVELEDGHAVVRMDVETKYAPLINRDASLLLRPKTGLADMVIQVDPGTAGQEIEEGDTVPLASTKPQVNADEVLATLDGDTRNYLVLLLQGAAEGLGTDEKALAASAALRRLEPTTRDIARINSALATRRQNLARVIHNFGLLAEELGRHDQQLAQFIDSNNAVFDSFAKQQGSIRDTLRELPSTLAATNRGLGEANRLSITMRQALPKLIPSAAVLKAGLESTQQLFTETTPPIRDQIRPFTRQVRAPVQPSDPGRDAAEEDGHRAEDRALEPQLRAQRACLQPQLKRRQLPLLPRLAEPQLQLGLPQPGRLRPASPRDDLRQLPDRDGRGRRRGDPSIPEDAAADNRVPNRTTGV